MIVIPMVDQGNRFREAGHTTPKFMLTWRRKSLFFHALDSFRAHFATEKFLIILQDKKDVLSFVERELLLLDIPRNRVAVIALKNATNGQAETVAVGLQKAQVPLNAPLTIFNPDTYRRDFVYPFPNFDLSGVDGCLETFSEDGEDRTFIRPKPDRANKREVSKASEKSRIFDLRNTGLHYFRSCEFYLELYAEMKCLQPNELQSGERHITPLYDQAIKRGADIRYVRISSDDVRFFDTLAEYGQRLRETPSDKPLAFCISGQIRSDRRHLEAIAYLAREHEADVYISTWRKRGRVTNLFNVNKLFKLPKHNMIRLFGLAATRLLPLVNMEKIFIHTSRLLSVTGLEDCSNELKEIFPDAVIDIEEEDNLVLASNVPQVSRPRFGDINSLNMSYKIWRCNRLKRAGEAIRGRKYEGVVRFRSDIIPSLAVFKATKIQHNVAVFNDRTGSKFAFDDTFWLCSSQTDDQLSNFFGKVLSTPGKDWNGLHKEIEDWVKQLSLTVMRDRFEIEPIESSNLKDQTFARSVLCDTLRNGQYNAASTDLTQDDAKILADIIECSEYPFKANLTIDKLRSMYSPKRALVVVRGILISALSISEPPYRDPDIHRHCADLILLTMTTELGWTEICLRGAESAMLREVMSFLAPFRNINRNDEPLLRGAPETRQPHDLWREVSNLLQDRSNTTVADSPLDELVWTVHRDLQDRLGEERFLMIARSIRDRT